MELTPVDVSGPEAKPGQKYFFDFFKNTSQPINESETVSDSDDSSDDYRYQTLPLLDMVNPSDPSLEKQTKPKSNKSTTQHSDLKPKQPMNGQRKKSKFYFKENDEAFNSKDEKEILPCLKNYNLGEYWQMTSHRRKRLIVAPSNYTPPKVLPIKRKRKDEETYADHKKMKISF